jgi:hypothetical protein
MQMNFPPHKIGGVFCWDAINLGCKLVYVYVPPSPRIFFKIMRRNYEQLCSGGIWAPCGDVRDIELASKLWSSIR